MTTPRDWRDIIPELKDKESLEVVKRIVEFQRVWVDTTLGHLDEALKQIAAMEKKLSK